MVSVRLLAWLMVTCVVGNVCAQAPSSYPTLGEIVRADPQLDALIAPGTQIEVLASGFDWSEGPVWVPRDGGYLLFSDVPANTIFQWQAEHGVRVFLKPSGYTGLPHYSGEPGSNGLVLDPEGRLVACEHGDRRVSLMDWQGGKITLADQWNGKRFNSPNDAVFHPNGDLYFTDPPYGLPQREQDPRMEYGFCGVFRVTPQGSVSLVTDELTRPNGIAFSPDGKTLYVAQSDSNAPLIRAFDLRSDGTLANSRIFYDASKWYGKYPGSPDGMTVDVAGNLFATCPGGVHVVNPEGKLLGRIDTRERTANCCWGGDGSTLFLTADMYLCRVKTTTQGLGF